MDNCYQGFIAEKPSLRVALNNASSEATIVGLRDERSKNTESWRLSRVLRLFLIIKEMDLFIWLLSRSMIQNRRGQSISEILKAIGWKQCIKERGCKNRNEFVLGQGLTPFLVKWLL
jgi:hypothetical protein